MYMLHIYTPSEREGCRSNFSVWKLWPSIFFHRNFLFQNYHAFQSICRGTDFFLAFPLTFMNGISVIIWREAVRWRQFPNTRFCFQVVGIEITVFTDFISRTCISPMLSTFLNARIKMYRQIKMKMTFTIHYDQYYWYE